MDPRLRIVLVLSAVMASASAAVAQWGTLTGALGSVGKTVDTATGFNAGSSAGTSPAAWALLATGAFLDGGAKLLEATGHATESAKCRALKDNINRDGPTKEHLGEVNEVAAEINQIADKQANLDKADAHKVTQAAVMVGVATYFETRVVNASRSAVASGDAAHMVQMAGVGLMAPGNLKSMLSVQSALFSYLNAKGIDVTADISKEVAKIDKA